MSNSVINSGIVYSMLVKLIGGTQEEAELNSRHRYSSVYASKVYRKEIDRLTISGRKLTKVKIIN